MSTTPSQIHHDRRWTPETRLGMWALSLTGLAVGGTVALAIAFSAGLESAESFTDNWLLSARSWPAGRCAATGLLALIRRHDHSWLVVAATAVYVPADRRVHGWVCS